MLGGPGSVVLFPLVLLVLMIFLQRGQSKKQRELESNIKIGDRVITRAGAIGKVTEVGDRIIKLELAPGVNVQFLKNAIEGVDAGDPKAKDDKKDGKDSKDEKKDKDDKKDDKPKSDKK